MEKFFKKCETVVYYLTIIFILYVIGLVLFSNNKPVKKEWMDAEEVEYEEFIDSIMKIEKEAEENNTYFQKEKTSFTRKIKKDDKIFKVTVTKYNPVKEQCDDDPLITADNSKICLNNLNAGKLKWVAVSRDLRKHFKYGEKVIIKCDHDPSINGEYEVHDTMNPRYTRTIDLLSPIGDTKGKWKDVEIKKARN